MKYLIINILIFYSLKSLGQKFDNDDMHHVGNNKKVYYYYQDSLLGCNYDQDCRNFSISFSKVEFNKKNNTLHLCGNIFLHAGDRPIINTEIFAAHKIGDTLVDKISYFISSYDKFKTPSEGGKFDISITAKKGYYLYFSHAAFALREFDVYRLVNP